jgi:glycerol-3-phosphate dehydrogenase
LSDAAVAVTPRYAGARTYFRYSWRDGILAGTFHAPWDGPIDDPQPTAREVDLFLSDLNRAVPGLELTTDDIVRVYSGLLPAKTEESRDLAVREVILDHGARGGPVGLWSVSGVKFTTARLVAEKTLRHAFASEGRDLRVRLGSNRPMPACAIGRDDPRTLLQDADQSMAESVRQLIEEEAVVYMEDLLLRRTDWGRDPQMMEIVAKRVTGLTGWELPSRETAAGSPVKSRSVP